MDIWNLKSNLVYGCLKARDVALLWRHTFVASCCACYMLRNNKKLIQTLIGITYKENKIGPDYKIGPL